MASDVRLSVLDRIGIASPCSARWEDMTGDDRVRHCAQCNLKVTNLSALSQAEAEALLTAHFGADGTKVGGRLCAQWRRRADGTIIFGDCPEGLARVRARMKRSVVRLAAMVGVTTAFTSVMAWAQKNGWEPRQYGSFTAVAGWLGADSAQTLIKAAPAIRGEVMMGRMTMQRPPAPAAPTPAPGSTQGGTP